MTAQMLGRHFMMSFNIAKRFITDKKVQSFIIIFGFAIGISTNLFIGNLIPSIRDDLIDRTVNSIPHITIEPKDAYDDFILNPSNIASALGQDTSVKSYTSILEYVIFMSNIAPAFPKNIIIRGFDDLSIGNQMYHFLDGKFEGRAPEGINEIIIGKSLAEKYNISIGFEMYLGYNPFSHSSTYYHVNVTGIFDLGSDNLNELWLICNGELTRKLFDKPTEVSEYIIQVKNIYSAKKIASELENEIGRNDIKSSNWQDENESLLNSMKAQSISVTIVQFFILLSVAISIASVLGINVMQKAKQIGILKSMGLSHRGAANIFVVQGTIYGIIGSILGFFMGLFFIGCFNFFGGPDIVNIKLRVGFTIGSILISITAANIASILPAIRSSKMQVIDIIRKN